MPKEPRAIPLDPDNIEETVEQAVERSYGKKMVDPIKKSEPNEGNEVRRPETGGSSDQKN